MSKSKLDTYEHIREVQNHLFDVVRDMSIRQLDHDESKLYSPEVEIFEEYGSKLSSITYGSDEYYECLEAIKPALEHHYRNNPHHPEFHENGIQDMTLAELIEMLADWSAAVRRHADGDIYKSIELNQKRFGYSDELKQIFINTVKYFGWD